MITIARAVVLTALVAAAPAPPIILWSGPPPACPRVGSEIVTYAATLDAAAAKAQRKAQQRGASHLYIIRAWTGDTRAKVESAAYRCEGTP